MALAAWRGRGRIAFDQVTHAVEEDVVLQNEVDSDVLGIFGLVYRVSALVRTPLSRADTICQGGTFRSDGSAAPKSKERP